MMHKMIITAHSDSGVYTAEWLDGSELEMALPRRMSGTTAGKLETIVSRAGYLTEIILEYVRSK